MMRESGGRGQACQALPPGKEFWISFVTLVKFIFNALSSAVCLFYVASS